MSVKALLGPVLLALLLQAGLALVDAGAQPAPDPKNPGQDPKGPVEPPDKPVGPGERDVHDVEFSLIKFALRDNRFGFHLRDLDDKEGSNADYFGRVVLVYAIPLATNSPDVDEFKKLKSWFDDHRGQAALIGIFMCEAERGNVQVAKAKEFVKAHLLPGDRFFLSNKQFMAQVKEKNATPPYFIFLGRDGHVEAAVNRWFKRFAGRAEPVLNKLLGAPAPGRARPGVPEIEEVKAPVEWKQPENTHPDEG